MKSERIAQLPKTPMELNSLAYDLCGDFAALVEAESFFNLRGYEINLAAAIFNAAMDSTSALAGFRQLLPCALHTFHPTLRYAAVQEMIDRMVLYDDRAAVHAIGRMWPTVTAEQDAANRNLCFDLEALADANEFFCGTAGLAILCEEGPFTLDHVYRVFPCALHSFRPDLNLSEARLLMTPRSVILTLGGFGLVSQDASQASKDSFAARVIAIASEEERREFIFRVSAKKPWPGAPHA